MLVFLLAVFTPFILLAAGFLLGVIWLRDEYARLTALREEITQESATMQRLAHDRDADTTARGESPPTGPPIGPADAPRAGGAAGRLRPGGRRIAGVAGAFGRAGSVRDLG